MGSARAGGGAGRGKRPVRGSRRGADARGQRRADRGSWRSQPSAMPSYTVTVATGSQWFAGTDDYIYLSLVGSAGCSEKHLLDKPFYNDFERGAVRKRGWDRAGNTLDPSGRAPGSLRGSRGRAWGVSRTPSGQPKFGGGRGAGQRLAE